MELMENKIPISSKQTLNQQMIYHRQQKESAIQDRKYDDHLYYFKTATNNGYKDQSTQYYETHTTENSPVLVRQS